MRKQTSIPVYPPTLERVRQLKEDKSYDELINEWAAAHENQHEQDS